MTAQTNVTKEMRQMLETILQRLDLEAKQQGENAVFMLSAVRPQLRTLIAEARRVLPI